MKKRIQKFLFKWKYPKLTLLIICIGLAYWLFSNPVMKSFLVNYDPGILTVVMMGYLFSFGFSAPFAIGFFLSVPPGTEVALAVLGGFGAMLGDLTIFGMIRFSFKDEFKKLKSEKVIKKMSGLSQLLPKKVRLYLLYAIAGLVIASPLPDEFGVAMVAGLTKIKPGIMAIISFSLNTFGIWIMLEIGKLF